MYVRACVYVCGVCVCSVCSVCTCVRVCTCGVCVCVCVWCGCVCVCVCVCGSAEYSMQRRASVSLDFKTSQPLTRDSYVSSPSPLLSPPLLSPPLPSPPLNADKRPNVCAISTGLKQRPTQNNDVHGILYCTSPGLAQLYI